MKINNKIKVLSLFDGISCGRVALERAGFEVEEYYASEIDKYALKITRKNYPDIIHLGDVTKVDGKDFRDIDLMIFGPPCQAYSIAGKRKGLDDSRGELIYEVFRLLKECKPDYFLFENVMGLISHNQGATFKYILTEFNNCGYALDWVVINSSLVSAQNRKRIYVIGKKLDLVETKQLNKENIIMFRSGVEQPKDKVIFLKDILEKEVDAKYYLSEKIQERFRLTKQPKSDLSIIGTTKPESRTIGQRDVVYGTEGKMGALVATDYKQPKQICDQIGEVDIKGFDCIKRVYSGEGKCPTLTSMQGGHRQPKILDVPVANAKDGVVLEATGAAFRNQITKRGLESQLNIRKDNKSNCVVPTYPNKLNCVSNKKLVRKLTPLETERLQTLPDLFTAKGINEKGEEVDISDSQRYKVIGNCWTVDVIAHIFKNIKI